MASLRGAGVVSDGKPLRMLDFALMTDEQPCVGHRSALWRCSSLRQVVRLRWTRWRVLPLQL